MTLVRDDRRGTAAASDSLVGRADSLQYELDEGPCLAAYRNGRIVRVDDTSVDRRRPRWSEAAQRMGLRSSLSIPLDAKGDILGAIKVDSTQPSAFDDQAETLLGLFASQAGIFVSNVQSHQDSQRLSAQLRDALASRDTIGQAKGVIMARDHVDEQAALATLVALSQRTHRKLHDVARTLTQTTAPREL